MAEAQIAIRNTAPKYLKGAADQTIRNRVWLAMLKKEGRMTFNHPGTSINWNMKVREPVIRNHESGVGVTYSQLNAYEQLTLPVAGLIGTDALDLKVQMMNKDPLAIIDLYGTKLEDLLKTASRSLGKQFYLQNTGNDNQLMGIRTACVPQAGAVAADIIVPPASTAAYGGKSCQLGALGGSWSADRAVKPSSLLTTDWPYGSGTADYDCLAPKMLNYTSTTWTGTATWRANAAVVSRRALNFIRHLGGSEATPDILLLSNEMHDEFFDLLEVRERIFPSDYLKDLGYPADKLMNWCGALVTTDFDCPAQKGYALNTNEMELYSSHEDLFFTHGPEFDNTQLASQFLVGFFGQLRHNPKYVVEMGAYA